ncbi:MAG TPA: hypothetical protein VFU81_17830, partial [Thermomicrobiales bacterium]|nr:hypothetical protein [Thermomicrobiales bacterium]
QPATQPNLLFPAGAYLLGISRSGTVSGDALQSDAYRLTIAAGDPLPPLGDREPNDSGDAATAVASAFSLTGDRQGSDDWYAWTIAAADAAKGWELDAQAGVGESLTIQLQDSNGATITNAATDATGRIALYDLGLAPGTYRIDIAAGPDRPSPYLLRAVAAGPRPTADIEPNDDLTHASPLDPAKPAIKGRLARAGDVDVYRLTVDAALAATQFDLKLIWRSKQDRELCLLDAAGQQLQCRTGAGGVALANLTLPPGDYGVAVSGDADPADPYILRLERTSAPAADFETEPNDAITAATPLEAGQIMRGRLTETETDFYRLQVTGAPQLWQARVDGAGVAELALIDVAGRSLASASAEYSGGQAQLSDLFLTAGDHWLAVSGQGGDYTLRADPTGPPDPNGEREPNDTTADAMPLPIGQ